MPTNQENEINSKLDNRSDSQTEDDIAKETRQLLTSEDRATSDSPDTGNMTRLYRSVSEPNLHVSCLQCTLELPNNSNETIQTASDKNNTKPSDCSKDDFEMNILTDQKDNLEPNPKQEKCEEIQDGFVIFQLKVGPLAKTKENKSIDIINAGNPCSEKGVNRHTRQFSLPNSVGNRPVAQECKNQVVSVCWSPIGVNNFNIESQTDKEIILILQSPETENSACFCSERIDDKMNELSKDEIALHNTDEDSNNESEYTSSVYDHGEHENLSYNSNCSTSYTKQCDDESCYLNQQQSNSYQCDYYGRCSSPAIALQCRNPQHGSMHCHPPLCHKPPPHRLLRPLHSPIHHSLPRALHRCPHSPLPPPHPHARPHPHPHPRPHPHPHFHSHPHPHPHAHPPPPPPHPPPVPHHHHHHLPLHRPLPHPHSLPQTNSFTHLHSHNQPSPSPCVRQNSSNAYPEYWQSPVDRSLYSHIHPSYRFDCFSGNSEWPIFDDLHCISPVCEIPSHPLVYPPPFSVSSPAVQENIYPPIRNRVEMSPYQSLDRPLANRDHVSMEPIVRVIRYDATSQTIGLEPDMNIPIRNNNTLVSKISRYENEIARNELMLNRLQRQLNKEINGAVY